MSEVRAFVGMANYYSKFIDNFAEFMSPLYSLLQKESPLQWSKECQRPYDDVKKAVTSDQVLVHFNPDLPMILTTDASNNAVGGIFIT